MAASRREMEAFADVWEATSSVPSVLDEIEVTPVRVDEDAVFRIVTIVEAVVIPAGRLLGMPNSGGVAGSRLTLLPVIFWNWNAPLTTVTVAVVSPIALRAVCMADARASRVIVPD
jgi:hypothetical protein